MDWLKALGFSREFDVFDCAGKWCDGRSISHELLQDIHSTNDLAKTRAFDEDSDLRIYLARQQQNGRGRGGNTWLNTRPGTQLLNTWSFHVSGPPQVVTSPLIGLAVYRALLSAFPDAPWSIKAPNDIYLNEKKVAGLLVETVSKGEEHRLLIGLGLNIWEAPTELSEAGCLRGMTKLNRRRFHDFLDRLHAEFHDARHACLAPHLTESQRSELLLALNSWPRLTEPYDTVSPFGDLISPQGRHSWRDL